MIGCTVRVSAVACATFCERNLECELGFERVRDKSKNKEQFSTLFTISSWQIVFPNILSILPR